MCPFKGTEGTKDTLEALEKGLESERQAAQSRLARNTGCRPCSVGVHARRELERDWCVLFIIRQGIAKSQLRRKSLVPIWKFDKKFLQDLV